MKNYTHYTGPEYPICQYTGTKVLNPYVGEDIVSQDEAIGILMCGDPRRKFKGAKEATYLRTQS